MTESAIYIYFTYSGIFAILWSVVVVAAAAAVVAVVVAVVVVVDPVTSFPIFHYQLMMQMCGLTWFLTPDPTQYLKPTDLT